MSAEKKRIRKEFREAVFARDGWQCIMCGLVACPAEAEEVLDAHHITDRNEMPNGGYVPENGGSLCKVEENCHLKAEKREPGYEPETLYQRIGSSYEKAFEASERLNERARA